MVKTVMPSICCHDFRLQISKSDESEDVVEVFFGIGPCVGVVAYKQL